MLHILLEFHDYIELGWTCGNQKVILHVKKRAHTIRVIKLLGVSFVEAISISCLSVHTYLCYILYSCQTLIWEFLCPYLRGYI